jgi:hypothetical protein
MRTIIATLVLILTTYAIAQSPSEYAALKAAGKVTLAPGTKQSAPDKDGKTTTERDPDKVLYQTQQFSPSTGEPTGTRTLELSVSGMRRDLANAEAEVARLRAMLADVEAVK